MGFLHFFTMQLLSPTQASGYTKHPLRNALFVLALSAASRTQVLRLVRIPDSPHLASTCHDKKESRGSFEGRITKEPRPSFICNYMVSHLGIKFKVNVYI